MLTMANVEEARIERGVPINTWGSSSSVIRKLKPGESVFFRIRPIADQKLERARLSTLAGNIRKREFPNRVFVTRCVEGGIRIWRTK